MSENKMIEVLKPIKDNKVSNKNIFNALIKFQKDLKNPIKNTSAFKYKYSPIEVCWDAVRDNLAANGLGVTQFPLNKDDKIGVRTMIIHSSGEFLESEYFVESLKKDIQSIGGIYSYCRRYAFCMALGITPHGEDFDGKDAMPTDDDLKSIQTDIDKKLKLIDDKIFIAKVEKYISENKDYKILTNVLSRVEEQIKKEEKDV
ncbi:MAG: ERF family protein [Bacteriovoracales bacterium]